MREAVLIIHSDSVIIGGVSGVYLLPTASAKTPPLSIRRGVRTVPQMVPLRLRRGALLGVREQVGHDHL